MSKTFVLALLWVLFALACVTEETRNARNAQMTRDVQDRPTRRPVCPDDGLQWMIGSELLRYSDRAKGHCFLFAGEVTQRGMGGFVVNTGNPINDRLVVLGNDQCITPNPRGRVQRGDYAQFVGKFTRIRRVENSVMGKTEIAEVFCHRPYAPVTTKAETATTLGATPAPSVVENAAFASPPNSVGPAPAVTVAPPPTFIDPRARPTSKRAPRDTFCTKIGTNGTISVWVKNEDGTVADKPLPDRNRDGILRLHSDEIYACED